MRNKEKRTMTVTLTHSGGREKKYTFALGATSRGHMAPGVRFHADKRRQTRAEDRREVRQNWRDL